MICGARGQLVGGTVPGAGSTVTISNATNNPVLINVSPNILTLIGSTNSASLNSDPGLTVAGHRGWLTGNRWYRGDAHLVRPAASPT